jgi:hypothetical protein
LVREYRLIAAKRHTESGPLPWLTLNGYVSVMVAYNGLNDGEAESGAVVLSGVVRSKQPLTLFRSESLPGVGYLKNCMAFIKAGSQLQCPAVWHSIQRV